MRERVTAEVVWIASIGSYDCEGRSVQSWERSEHDSEGDARRWMVESGMFERTKWGKTDWRDDHGYRVGSVTRTICEITAGEAGDA